jgi:preprotein translocase subunit SecA
MMTKSIERAQKRETTMVCKRLLEYDDVMNEVVYKRRRHAPCLRTLETGHC